MQNVKYVYPVTTVFPETIATILGTESNPCNGTYSAKSGLLDNLRVVDYRYNRFALDPRTGLFTMVRYVNSLLHPLQCKNFFQRMDGLPLDFCECGSNWD